MRRVAASLIATHRALGVDEDALVQVLQRMQLRKEAAGATLYEEGERAESVDFLLQGRVRVISGGDAQELTRLEAPAVVGHLGVLTGLPRSATVVTEGATIIGRLEFREIWALVSGEATTGQALRRLLLASLAQLEGRANAALGELLAPPKPQGRPPSAPTMATAPRRKPEGPPPTDALGALTAQFDPDLLDQAERVELVETEAARRERYRR